MDFPEAAPSDSDSRSDVEYFQQLADGAPVMIWMSGRDMGCFYFNRAWLDYRGRTLEDEFGNGWVEGVHPDDLERCVQHYVCSFERRGAFAMSYRLLDRSGEYQWILDRGAPHFGADGGFLGFFGGCAVTPAENAVERIAQLRKALHEMETFAQRVALREANVTAQMVDANRVEGVMSQIELEHRAREHAASLLGKLATDMLTYDRIEKGACLR
ncbi:MAG TPA: PAS domain-containing protein [Verrucomicrobiae bacterium]|nr:PAS domain-containing protein [Verrucomicrobiae bacterium]